MPANLAAVPNGKTILAACFINGLGTVIALGLIISPFTVKTLVILGVGIVFFAVLPAYIIGMVLAGTVGKDHFLIRRLRALTFGFLTPFYFIRAGSLVFVPALIAAPLVLAALFFAKMGCRLAGLLPTVRMFGNAGHDGVYYSLMMSTGLTFGTISAPFGLNHDIINQMQYSHLVAAVIGTAVIPTAIANVWFMPRHLLPSRETETKESVYGEPVGDLES